MNKKWMIAMTAALMLCGLTACGGDSSTADTGSSTAAESSAPEESADSEAAADSEVSSEAETESADNADAAPDASAGGAIDFDYNANGTVIVVGEESDPIIAALGNSDSVFEAPSCAFTGTSYYYTFGGLQVVTYPDEHDQTLNRIYEVDLQDDTVATNEGIKVGSTYDDMVAAYGTPDQESAAYAMYTTEGKAVQFFLSGNDITQIVYTIVIS